MRYYFHLTDGNDELDPGEGIDLLGNVAARDEGVRMAQEIKAGRLLPGRAWDNWFIRILDERGHEGETVPIHAAPEEDAIRPMR